MSERRYHIKTFGCQMNVHDSRRIAEILGRIGYAPADGPRDADVLFVNGCTVREKAWHKAISEAGRLRGQKRRRPGAIVGVVGCVAQQEGARLFDLVSGIDLVVSPDHYGELPGLLEDAAAGRRRAVVGFDSGRPEDFLARGRPAGPALVSDFVTVMKGCEERCAYCIVPSVRGPERFRPKEDVAAEVAALVDCGVREVTLLGQKVNAYVDGRDGFAALLDRLDAIGGLARLRFTSPHPRHMDRETAARFGRLRPLCEAIHLPVQSGSDRVLARMRRRYRRGDYLEAIGWLREACPEIAISTDLIVGYPGETEADFAATLDLLERVRFANVFSFKYSPRPGTPAAELDDDVGDAEKARRLAAAHEIIERNEREIRAAEVGRVRDVLVEGAGRMPGQVTGRTRGNHIVNFVPAGGASPQDLCGALLSVRVTRANPHSLEGEPAR